MNRSDPTSVVQLTGSGRGAVATVLVDGPLAVEVVRRCFTPVNRSLAELKVDQICFGTWRSDEYEEELVVCRTGDAEVEIHCHGGRFAARQIVSALTAEGLNEISPVDALAREETDANVLRAKSWLPNARTERVAAILLDQARGALRTELDRLLEVCARGLEPHERILWLARLDRLIELGATGARLDRPFSVVLLGRPNVGKSSLVNAIAGYERAIVFDQPGTTRDPVPVEVILQGWPCILTDTAGLRESTDAIEQEGIRRAGDWLRQADLVLALHDLSAQKSSAREAPNALSGQPDSLTDFDLEAPVIRVGTKSDLAEAHDESVDYVTSARTGAGVAELLHAAVERLVPAEPEVSEAVPLLPASLELLQQVKAVLLSSADLASMNSTIVRRLRDH